MKYNASPFFRAAMRIALFILCVPASSFAKTPQFLFGPEFTFGVQFVNGQVINLDSSTNFDEANSETDDLGEEGLYKKLRRYHRTLKEQLVAKPRQNKKFKAWRNRYTSPKGWAFFVNTDPGVIEIQMSPMTVKNYKKNAKAIQRAIFSTAAKLSFYPALFTGGGHINIGLKEFEENPRLLRNFIIDYYNHVELSMGVMNYDVHNAASPLIYENHSHTQLLRLIEYIDHALKLKPVTEEFADSINLIEPDESRINIVKDLLHSFGAFDNPKDVFGGIHIAAALRGRAHYSDIKGRLEIRAVRPQASMDVWVRQIQLLQKRLEYLDSLDGLVEYKSTLSLNPGPYSPSDHYNPPVNAQEALKAFYLYVTESKEKWQDHRDYLWPKWITNGEIDRFEQSDWFKGRQLSLSNNHCADALGG